MLYIKKYVNNNEKSNAFGKTYGKPVIWGTVEIGELAKAIEEKCTVHEADVLAVLTALKGVVAEKVQNGWRVHLPGLGYFKIGISTKGEVLSEDFDVHKNVLRTRVLFQPENTKDNTNHRYTNPLTRGVTFRMFSGLVNESDLAIIGDDIGASGSDSGSNSGGSGNNGGDDDTPVENRP